MPPQASHHAPVAALLAIQARLSPPLPLAPDSASSPRSALDTATAGLHTWLGDLAALDGKPPDAVSDLAAFVREKHLSYKVPSGAEKGMHPDGTKAVAMLDAMRDLVDWLLGRVLDKAAQEEVAREWGEVLVAVLLGIERHLRDNDFGDERTLDEVLKYRKLFVDRLYKPLLRVIFPAVDTGARIGIDKMTGQTVDAASGSRAVPRWAKYAAFASLAASMSRNKYAKSTLRELLPPDYLAATLQSGADSHLSHLALEVAFRIAPPAPKPKSRNSTSATPAAADKAQAQERDTFVGALLPQSRFGYDNVKLQKRFNELTVVDWFGQTSGLLQAIADGHIKRSQPFRVLSLDYDGYPLLDRPHDSQRPSSAIPDKPDEDEIADGFYESAMLWFGRHELAVELHEPPEMVEEHKAERRRLGIESVAAGEDEGDGYEVEREKAVVELKAVHHVHVEDLGTDLELMRVTFIIAAASPLKIGTRAHPGEATHVGTGRTGQTESQIGGLGIYHKLVAVTSTRSNNLGTLKKVIEERGSIYTMLRQSLVRYPIREPVLPPVDDHVPPKPAAAAATPAPPKPVAPKPVAPKPVTPKVSTTKRGAPSPSAASAADKRKCDGPSVAKVHAVERAPRKSSQAGPVVAEPSPPPLAPEDERTSQEEEARRRRKEVAQLADLAVGSSPVQAGASREAKGKGKGYEEDAMALDEEFGGGPDEDEEMEETAQTDSIVEESVELYGPSHKKVVASTSTSKPAKPLVKRVLRRTAFDVTDPDSAGPDSTSLEVDKPRAGPAAASTSTFKSTSKNAVVVKPAPVPSTAAPAGEPEFKVPAKKAVPAQRKPAMVVAPPHESPIKKVVTVAVERAPPSSESFEAEPQTHPIKKVVGPTAGRHEDEQEDEDEDEPAPKEGETATATGGNGRPRRAAASKAEAKFKGSKRGRVDDELEASSDEGEDKDFDEASKTRAPTRGKKKAVKDAAPPPAAKRPKKTPAPAPEPDSPLTSEPETDYDDERLPHASLSTTRRSEPTAKKYGRQPNVVQPAAKTRKAASSRAKVTSPVKKRQSKKRIVEKRDEEASEGDEVEKDEETSRSRTTRSRGAAKKKQVVVQSPQASDTENVSPRKKGDKRVSDDIPPPRDLDADELQRVKEFEALKKPRSNEGVQKEKAVQSFSQLVSRDRIRTPPDEIMAEAEPLGGLRSEDQAANVEGEDDSFDPGFYLDDLAHVPALDAVAPGPAHVQDLAATANANAAVAPPHQRASSPSPLLDPAKDDTFVERAVPAAKERPAILVPDSPPQAAAAAAKARAVTAPARSSPHPQQHPPQPQHPPPRPLKPVAKPVGTSPAHEPMQVDSPAGPHGADDSGVHFAPPLGERSTRKGQQGVQRVAASAAASTAARTGPSAALAHGGLGPFPSALKLGNLGLTTPSTAQGALTASTTASRAFAPQGALTASTTASRAFAPQGALTASTTASRAFAPFTTAAGAVAGPSSARPVSVFSFSPARAPGGGNAPLTSTTAAAGAPWTWARPEVDQATQVGASLETGLAPPPHHPQQQRQEPRSPHKEHSYLDAAALRDQVGPPPPQPQIFRRPFDAAPRAAPTGSRRFVPATTLTSTGFSRTAQGSAAPTSRFARDRSSFAPLGHGHAPVQAPQYQGRAAVAGPSMSTPRRAGAGRGGGAAGPSPARAQAHERAQQQQQQQQGGAADGDWKDDDETLLRFSEEFGRALVDKQRERRERRRAIEEAGMRRHDEIVGQYVDQIKDEALSLASLVAARAAHHAAQCAPEHPTTRALQDVGDKVGELRRWLEEVAGELGEA